MGNNDAAATALATIGTVLWCIQLIPQIYYNWKRKDCTGLPPIMMFLWVISGIPFAIYFCIIDTNITLQVQPHLFALFSGIGYVQSCYYPPASLPIRKIIAFTGAIIVVDIAMEVGFILWLRPLYARGTEWPALIFGILASVLLAVGLIPPYFELAKRKGRVVGINFVFLTLDSLGAWFSIASVAVGEMDVLGIILYAIIAGLELGIFLSHFIWLCRFRWFINNKFHDGLDEDLDVVVDKDDTFIENITNIQNGDDILSDEILYKKYQARRDYENNLENDIEEENVRLGNSKNLVHSIRGINFQRKYKKRRSSCIEDNASAISNDLVNN